MWKLNKAWPGSFLQLYKKSGTEIEDNCSFAEFLLFCDPCLNHILWEADCVSKLNTPVVFHCLLAGHAAFLIRLILESISAASGERSYKSKVVWWVSSPSPGLRSPHLMLRLLLLLQSTSIGHISAWTVLGSSQMPTNWCPLQFNNHLVDRINLVKVVNTLSLYTQQYMQFLEHH